MSDLPSAAVPPNCHKVTLLSAIGMLWRSQAETIELPEPLWIRFLPCWLLLATVWKLRRLRGCSTTIGIYAIENNTLGTLFFGRRRAPPALVALGGAMIRLAAQVFINRCAFGSADAAAVYMPLLANGRRRIEVCTIPELPTSRINADLASKRPFSAAFVGRLEKRKGIAVLMRAWPEVETIVPDAHLTILGDGPLTGAVATWVAQRPDHRAFLGMQSRDSVLTILQDISVVVAPSVPDGRWREQIGLAITEAISMGATVVTTTETGLAASLERQGHTVIPTDQLTDRLAIATARALQTPLPVADVVAGLPTVDTRLQVDRWIHRSIGTD